MTDLHRIKNFRPVNEHFFTSGQPNEEQLASLQNSGVQVVINLGLHDDPSYSLTDEAGTVQALGMEYIHIPVDFNNPTQQNLTDFITWMKIHENKHTLVHCAANYRVSAFLGLYLHKEKGWLVEDAFAQLYSLWTPNAVWEKFVKENI